MAPVACTACQQNGLEPLIDLGIQPLVGFYPDSLEVAQKTPRYPLRFHFCRFCGHVEMSPDLKLPVETLFSNYSYASTTVSPALKSHFDRLAAWIKEELTPRRVLEVGCGDGVLLDSFREQGTSAVGVEVAENIAELARSKGNVVYSGAFGPALAQKLRGCESTFDMVTASNAFPHNPDPRAFLAAVREVLVDGGYLMLEVMSAAALAEDLQWDTLYHEHPHVHTARSLRLLLESAGFGVLNITKIPMHQGSLRVIAQKGRPTRGMTAVEHEESSGFASYLNQCRRFDATCKRSMVDLLDALPVGSWAYGAGARAVMWINAAALHDKIDAVVDMSPLRYGKFIPGTRIPIVTPASFRDARPKTVLITAWNYAPQVREKEGHFQGTWIVPLPALRRYS